MTGLPPGARPVRDVAGYERRRYPPGYLSRYKRHQDVRTLHESIGPGPMDVLDVPCGSGRLIGPMIARGYRVVGADASSEMLEAARRGLAGDPGLRGLVLCDARQLPFRSRSFDLVVCMRFLYYFEEEDRCDLIREMARITRRSLLLQYRLRETVPAFLWKLRHAAGITRRDRSRRCMTVREIRTEVEGAAPLRVVRVRRVSVWFSDRAYVLCVRRDA